MARKILSATTARIALAFGALLSIGTASTSAMADTVANCKLAQVGYRNANSGTITITCDNVTYYNAQGTASGCSYGNAADTLRAWLTLLEAAELSGKTVNFDWFTCGTTKLITAVTLNR